MAESNINNPFHKQMELGQGLFSEIKEAAKYQN